MKRVIFFLALALMLGGCETARNFNAISSNRNRLARLTVGMPKEKVLNIMKTKPFLSREMTINNPYKIDLLVATNHRYEVFYYVIDTDVPLEADVITDQQLVPLVIENGKLVGWGWEYLHNVR
ncbi:MAG: DUF3192 domain-containing protein [Candidatus Omnitrophica bacterium]|nr:DUF3192 domain-containing protein [Candidatus Omnitrophota bacterium]